MTNKEGNPESGADSDAKGPEGQGFKGFLQGPWEPDDPNRALKLQLLNLMMYPDEMDAAKIKALFSTLTKPQKVELASIIADFVNAVADPEVVPMLIKVPKSTLSSKEAMIRIPASALSEEALENRRAQDAVRKRSYRSQMSEEDKTIQRKKTAERMRELRRRRKAP